MRIKLIQKFVRRKFTFTNDGKEENDAKNCQTSHCRDTQNASFDIEILFGFV